MTDQLVDYIVVGAGSSGCAAVGRLTADPTVTVLLLEAGGPASRREVKIPAAFSKLFKTPVDWDYSTTPQRDLGGRRLYWPRGKMLGGCSSINAQMWVRGNRADYDHWAALGCEGWSFGDVLGYFKRIENFERGGSTLRGAGGPQNVADLRDPNPLSRAFVEAAAAAGLSRNDDVNGEVQDGVGLTQVIQRRGRRCSAADAYLGPARTRPNLTVRTDAHAVRVLVHEGRAVGVEYLERGASRVARAAREIVLAAGAVNSPQLLLLSGIGPADHLRSLGIDVVLDLPGVGRNLQDHLAVTVVAECREPITLAKAESVVNLLRWLLSGRGMLTSNVGEACAFVCLGPGASAPDVELIFAPVAHVDHGLVKLERHGLTVAPVLLQPRSVGMISLASRDPLAPPVIEPRYLSDAAGVDLRLLVEGVRLAQRILATPPLAAYVGAPIMPAAGAQR